MAAGMPRWGGILPPFYNFCIDTAELAGLRVNVDLDIQTLSKINAYAHYYLISQLI